MRFFAPRLAALLLLTAAIAPAQAAVTEDNFSAKSTGDLVALCGATKDDPAFTQAANFCHGYAVAIAQAAGAHSGRAKHGMFCVPSPGPTLNDAIAAFVAWGAADPTRAALPAPTGVTRFLVSTYPCTTSKH